MTYSKDSLLHVEGHLVVVELHDADQALESDNLDLNLFALGSFADNLHDIVALALTSKVLLDEFQRVVKGLDGCQTNFLAGFLLACSLNDSCENAVGLSRQNVGMLFSKK